MRRRLSILLSAAAVLAGVGIPAQARALTDPPSQACADISAGNSELKHDWHMEDRGPTGGPVLPGGIGTQQVKVDDPTYTMSASMHVSEASCSRFKYTLYFEQGAAPWAIQPGSIQTSGPNPVVSQSADGKTLTITFTGDGTAQDFSAVAKTTNPSGAADTDFCVNVVGSTATKAGKLLDDAGPFHDCAQGSGGQTWK